MRNRLSTIVILLLICWVAGATDSSRATIVAAIARNSHADGHGTVYPKMRRDAMRHTTLGFGLSLLVSDPFLLNVPNANSLTLPQPSPTRVVPRIPAPPKLPTGQKIIRIRMDSGSGIYAFSGGAGACLGPSQFSTDMYFDCSGIGQNTIQLSLAAKSTNYVAY